ncbi:MAG TPA: CocE/NonD family hydrolase, partial [Acidimicrobiales bacterium]|nr:CocE/NonD family hydrolase [Acidimicrobiales bacterium]
MQRRDGSLSSRAWTLVVGVLALGLLPVAPAAEARPSAPSQAVECGTRFPTYVRAPGAGVGAVLGDVPITMSDGAVLRANVTLPNRRGPFPTALTITGYGKGTDFGALGGTDPGLVGHGYAVMVLDDRGTGTSQGQWDSWGDRTVADYREVLDWIVDQPWSDGRVGMTGASYMGITSLLAAASGHPAVKAVFATVPMGDSYRDIAGAGGQGNLAFIPLWLGLVTGLGLAYGTPAGLVAEHLIGAAQFQVPLLAQEVVGGLPAYDGPFWRQRSPIDVADRITVPTFLVGGLDDLFQRGVPMLYERLADHTDTRMLIGPWTHTTTGQGLPTGGVPSEGQLRLQWFDQHVRGRDTGAACIPPVTQYVRGQERYVSSPTWPVPDLTARRWHLQGDGSLTLAPPVAGSASRSYLAVPVTGLCTRSTSQWLIGLVPESCAHDNRIDELLGLTYTTEPFTTETVINGPIQADVWLTTDKTDAVVSVAVSDVAPDGTSRGLSNGLLLASHRAVDPARSRLLDGQSIQPWHPFTQAATLNVTPGEPTLVPIEVFPTSAAIVPGHRLRITITPYDLPHAVPPMPSGLDSFLGTVTVLSDAAHPSSVVLPVVDATAVAARTALTASGT